MTTTGREQSNVGGIEVTAQHLSHGDSEVLYVAQTSDMLAMSWDTYL